MGVPDEQYPGVIEALKSEIAANDGHLDTGIFGTQFFFEVLCENGLNELAYEVMNKTTKPSYGWWIEQGATTTWEQWDGTGSRNHPMFGGGLVWFYRNLAGMKADPENPGYKHIIIKPQPAGDLTFVTYSNVTPHGTASIHWEKEKDIFNLNIVVPAGSVATVYVPAYNVEDITENGKVIQEVTDVQFKRLENGYAVFTIGSGDYRFESAL
jgi:alpha-L-rhamnosidase